MKVCQVKECNNKHYGKGYCIKHYQQVRLYGKILDRTIHDKNEIVTYKDYTEVILYNRKNEEVARAIIDLEDVERVSKHKWALNSYGYVITNINRKTVYLHRFLLEYEGRMDIDHENGNKLDNRKSNLRIVTHDKNMLNRSKHSNNTSGKTGIYFDKANNKWKAYITINGKRIHLGLFNDFEQAKKVRKEAEIEYFGNYRRKD